MNFVSNGNSIAWTEPLIWETLELHDFSSVDWIGKKPGKLFLNDFAFQKGLIIQFLKCHETTDSGMKNFVNNCKLIPIENIYLPFVWEKYLDSLNFTIYYRMLDKYKKFSILAIFVW